MAMLFYLLLVWIRPDVNFSWGWFIVSVLFSGNDTRYIIRRENNTGEVISEEEVS